MKALRKALTRAHLRVFLALYLVFAAFTLFVLSRQSSSDWQSNWNLVATFGSLSGPFTGAVARGFQSCCWRFSLMLAPWCGAALLAGISFQFIPLPARAGWTVLRLIVWGLALLAWFGGGVISFGHALS